MCDVPSIAVFFSELLLLLLLLLLLKEYREMRFDWHYVKLNIASQINKATSSPATSTTFNINTKIAPKIWIIRSMNAAYLYTLILCSILSLRIISRESSAQP